MSAEKIISEWKKKNFKSLYWLEGEEPYYIDMVINYAEHHILNESEAGFNLTVFYGRDADWASVVNACMRYPMFAEKQVVLLKEAQQMKDIEKLENYVSRPLVSTIFVVGYKDKKLDARTKFAKLIKEKGEVVTTKKLYDNQLPEWTGQMIASHGLTINPRALALLVDHIGNDLNRLQNEVEKLSVNLGARKSITEEDIEKYIGISKEFNVFELQDAIAQKNLAKAIRIIQYFAANPKAAPIQLLLPTLYSYFSKIYSIYGMENKNEQALFGIFRNNFAVKAAQLSMNNYGYDGVEKILLLLHQYNLKSIGINDSGTEDADLMKEMVVKIMA
ncbi:DNA polymerase III subunit delta [Panacibacter ginsenosidivorans]|uniref:DNA polymerase III subunit delta n=1 Tax=Panacibacter ginsenosidivorans TaxID=1813871 RepID=A0A5B8VBS5_9BACT|nr:DNA polymerase III subunit delta [Panacibacter ginsenosidivorans]QEC68136.1 DNA polymerase III subunit delta [Panacibacter ginsenosidivorans]